MGVDCVFFLRPPSIHCALVHCALSKSKKMSSIIEIGVVQLFICLQRLLNDLHRNHETYVSVRQWHFIAKCAKDWSFGRFRCSPPSSHDF